MKKTVLLAFCSAFIIPEKLHFTENSAQFFLDGVMPKHYINYNKKKRTVARYETVLFPGTLPPVPTDEVELFYHVFSI